MKYELFNNSLNNMSKFVRTILQNRGIEDVESFMRSNEEDIENSSYKDLDNITDGIEILLKHLENGNKISLIVDPDVDGITSSAILYNYLNDFVFIEQIPKINWNIVTHSGKGHGFSDDIKIDDDTKLIITPDGGSNDFEAHKDYKEKGIDILVIDHHIVEQISQDAIIINNQTSERYKNKAFSGAGVVYRFIQAIDDKFFLNNADNYLDLVALGNIADVMDMSSLETRFFIQQGIAKENLKNPFLKILLKKVGVDTEADFQRYIYPIDVSFKIAPLINALLRLGTVEEKENLFKCFISKEEDLSTRKGICKDFFTSATEYKDIQDEEKQNLLEKISENLTEDDLQSPVLIFDVSNFVENTEIVGLTAMNVASRYEKPVILGTFNNETNCIGGSVRVNNGFPDVNFKDTCLESNLFEMAQGHQQAFGFSLKKENIDDIKKFFKEKYGENKLQSKHFVDFIIPDIKEIAPSDFFLIQSYKYLWGKGVEEPIFAIENISLYLNGLSTLGKKGDTIKYTYGNIEIMFFKCSEDDEILKLTKSGDITKTLSITIVGKLGISKFAGRTKNQIIVEDYEILEDDYIDPFDF